MKVAVNGVDLNVEVAGREDAPCVTLLTGITNDHTLWHDQVEPLSAKPSAERGKNSYQDEKTARSRSTQRGRAGA